MERLRLYWSFIRASLWFVPLLMSIAAVALAVLLLTSTGMPSDSAAEFWLLYSGDADNARRLLGALLSGMITMSSLVVSITVVVLTLAAGQLGPRMVRNFMGDWPTQVVIGLFVATILYLLVVFRTIGDTTGDGVPHLAVSVGTGLSALCMFVLLFYVHRLARSIMYDNAVRDVTAQLERSIARLVDSKEPVAADIAAPGEGAAWVCLGRHGYVQAIGFDRLADEARRADAVIWLGVRPGDYVLARGRHVAVHPPSACNDTLISAIRGAVVLGSERTPVQDLEFGIRQLVEIALRALSPGINDVFTSIAVIDNLTSALARLYETPLEPSVHKDADGRVRVHCALMGYEAIVRTAFDQIRHAGRTTPFVLIHLAEAIGRLASYAGTEERAKPLFDQLDFIRASGERHIELAADLDLLRARCRTARGYLEQELAKPRAAMPSEQRT
ncbi:DUF2254 domain-containing protein [Azospirillum sp. HJ39]|uniref:DUF2254 domain-containing protein n=1 Tax=Azospirillum sp. HJ39 TaxID=3159496 RepID=UPI0035580629